MLLAFDNTDGPDGGCTTHAAFHVLLALPELALRGLPRLVRLNPNVPWKTRGNAAVALPLGRPEGPQVRVGELRGREVLAFPEGAPADPSADVLARAWNALSGLAQRQALPGLVLCQEAPPAALYWSAVRTFVPPGEAKAAAAELGVLHRSTGDGRSLVGSLAAAAWPGPPSSFEVIAYREPQRWGHARDLDPAPLFGLDATGATFHTVDPVAGKLACVPRTPDPVLCGLRGRDPERLVAAAIPALARAAREPVDGWLLWASNQASGDHVTPVGAVGEAPAMGTVRVEAEVVARAERRQGGHAFVALRDGAGTAFEAVAFEPTHAFRDLLSALLPGDRVVVAGAFAEGLVKLEKLRIVAPVAHRSKRNPTCPACGRAMRSKGPSTGFRCSGCKTRLPPSALEWAESPRGVDTHWHEPPVMARRHLHRPAGWDSLARG
ncbi:MAG TPA: tRNA(Ile)(2)-agmatinylcytidine synthase [Candidatus Thermoplasmatota archaeon]|nr:tRNA(Ile)(2)-agmatinylcytidine synthase [Candidatus Thermoplasmatota archaeon]